MVKLEEVSAEQYEQVEVLSEEEDYSDFSDEDDFDDEDESLLDRIAALKDIIPLKHRNRVSNSVSTLTSWGKTGATFVGKSAWVITTSMFLLVLPLALEIEKEQALMLNSGNPYGQPAGQPQQQQVRAPGF
ncbi:hypothetical protein INT48_006388 [Thamnidium elegans]|uniref:Mitochondrial import receptor subunit TOM22 homolog n=1 Tax=Thamnidium elegans TaxID=101142 RepID=A0A8H7SLX2_9FUNG|nr:hypothetical protein INT48_006388 [Thamnidium elegans]